jgi:hypothetical protein
VKVRCVRLLDSRSAPVERSSWLKVGALHPVLSIWIEPDRTRFRILGEEAVPALFEPAMFEVVSGVVPSTWRVSVPKAGCMSLSPEPWSEPGFWERFYDREPDAVACFEDERAKIVAADP